MSGKKTALACSVSFGAGVLAVLIVAWVFGPRGKSRSFDLYTGANTLSYDRLGFRWQENLPDAGYVVWARKHRQSKDLRTCFQVASARSSGWFDDGFDADCFLRNIPLSLYISNIPEAEKVRLLRAYHADLDAALDSPPYRRDPTRELMDNWGRTLSELSPAGGS
jgi:hypothetical protein